MDTRTRWSGTKCHPDKKAKARLVVPQAAEIPRDSPTMSRLSRMLLCQLISNNRWDLRSFDVKTAFLRGNMQDQRLLGIELPEEMRARMNFKPAEICNYWAVLPRQVLSRSKLTPTHASTPALSSLRARCTSTSLAVLLGVFGKVIGSSSSSSSRSAR